MTRKITKQQGKKRCKSLKALLILAVLMCFGAGNLVAGTYTITADPGLKVQYAELHITGWGDYKDAPSSFSSGYVIRFRYVMTNSDLYSFDGWTGGYTGNDNPTPNFNATNGNVSLRAKTKKKSFTLTLQASPSTGGTVSGGGSYQWGTNHTVTASPASGYSFSCWKNGNTVVSNDMSFSYPWPSNNTTVLTAYFVQEPSPIVFDISKQRVVFKADKTYDGTNPDGVHIAGQHKDSNKYKIVGNTETGNSTPTQTNNTVAIETVNLKSNATNKGCTYDITLDNVRINRSGMKNWPFVDASNNNFGDGLYQSYNGSTYPATYQYQYNHGNKATFDAGDCTVDVNLTLVGDNVFKGEEGSYATLEYHKWNKPVRLGSDIRPKYMGDTLATFNGVTREGKLTIQGTGSLTIERPTFVNSGACIGSAMVGDGGVSSGWIVIESGTITLRTGDPSPMDPDNYYTWGSYGAAIGGGACNRSGNITINGGTINARACATPATIGGGGGHHGKGLELEGAIEINGGTLDLYCRGNAEAHDYGVGLGGGSSMRNGGGGATNITINGGTVRVYRWKYTDREHFYDGYWDRGDIGGGSSNVIATDGSIGNGGTANVYINGGTVIAGNVGGGTASQPSCNGGSAYIKMTGGNVDLSGTIGGGYSVYSNGGDATVDITGGSLVCNTIGGGDTDGTGNGGAASITIGDINNPNNNPVFSVTCGGIGGGDATSGNGGNATVRITNPNATLNCGSIGGGDAVSGDGGNASIYITGGTLDCKSIGGGDTDSGNPGNVEGSNGLEGVYIAGSNKIVMTCGYIGGGSNTNGSKIGKATAYINATHAQSTIQGQFILSNPNSTASDHCKFTMLAGTIDNMGLGGLNDDDYPRANANGGAVYMDDGNGEVIINGGTIKNCSGELGGAIYMAAGTCSIGGSALIQNSNAYRGGAVYMAGAYNKLGTFNMNGATAKISNCHANATESSTYAWGGAVAMVGNSVFNMINGTIEKCSSALWGGAIYMVNASSVFNMSGGTIGGSSLEYGNTSGYGGGIYMNGGTFAMTGGNINYNTASGYGGGAYVRSDNVDATITNGNIIGNNASTGGGIYMSIGNIIVGNSNISSNYASNNGGGLYVYDGNVLVSGGSISSNQATNNGGGIYANNGDIEFSSGTISSNTSSIGGGLYARNGSISANGGVIEGNTASDKGGGIFAYGGGNISVTGGIRIGTDGSNLGLANSAVYGGGIYVNNGNMNFNGGTIGGNYASMQGGGVYISEDATLNLLGNATITKNHVPTTNFDNGKGLGGGVYLAGKLVVGEARGGKDLCNVLAKDNYASDTPPTDANNPDPSIRNNVYLPNPTVDVSHKSVITVIENGVGTDSRVGFSVQNNRVPVIYCNNSLSVYPEGDAHAGEYTNQVYLDGFTTADDHIFSNVLFDDSKLYLSIHQTDWPELFDADHVYLYGYWPESVTSQPEPEEGFAQDDENKVVTISSEEALAWLITLVNGRVDTEDPTNNLSPHSLEGYTVNLTSDLNMSRLGWVPIGQGNPTNAAPFKGTFNGNGHVITGINGMEYKAHHDYGLFGYVDGGKVGNVFVSGAEYYLGSTEGLALGGLVGETAGNAEISNNEVVAKLLTRNPATPLGSIVGRQTAGKVHSCIGLADITGGVMGGLVGEVSGGELSNSFANATFHRRDNATSSQKAGGLVGINTGTIENCYVRLQGTAPDNFGWFAGTNNGTIDFCYAPSNATGVQSGTNGNYANTQLDTNGKYAFNHSDQAVTASNDYVRNEGIDNAGNLGGLHAALNNWVDDQGSEAGYSTWTRTMGSTINDDLPVLKFDDFAFVGSKDNVYLEYGNNLNTMLTAYNAETNGGSVYVYGSPTAAVEVNNGSNVKLYFGQDAGITQAANNTLNARVGVTLDDSSVHEEGPTFMDYDWHMFSTPLAAVPMGIVYNTTDYTPAFGSNLPQTGWNAAGYFPTNTPYGKPYTTEEEGSFDFYTYYEPDYHWINFKREGNDHWHYDEQHDRIEYKYWNGESYVQDENEPELLRGKGYMLAVSKPTILMADGQLTNSTVTIPLTATGEDDAAVAHKGTNLIGNPYQSYLNFDTFASNTGIETYYVLDADNKGYIAYTQGAEETDITAPKFIHPHQGFFVKVEAPTSINFTTAMRSATGNDHSTFRGEHHPLVNLVCTDEQGRNDFATVELNRAEQGGGLKAKGLHAGNASIWTRLGETDYHIAFAPEGTTTVPVRFKAYQNGVFTLGWGTANGEFSYLHLIDNMTGMDIDCLTTESYSFEGKTDDYLSRFKLVFSLANEGEDDDENGASTEIATFAFQMGDELVVNGEGLLQMFDVNGRCLMSTELNGQQNTIGFPTAAAGVYVLRLTSGENVKVQKMVVR